MLEFLGQRFSDPISMFDTFQFVWCIFAGQYIFLTVYAERRSRFLFRAVVSFLIQTVVALFYYVILYVFADDAGIFEASPLKFIVSGWFVALTLFLCFSLLFSFKISLADAGFFTLVGYLIQRIAMNCLGKLSVYILFIDLHTLPPVYWLVGILWDAAILFLVFTLFKKSLVGMSGRTIIMTEKYNSFFYVFLLIAVILIGYILDFFFRYMEGIPLFQALILLVDIVVCVTFLMQNYNFLNIRKTKFDVEIVKQLYMERGKQFEFSKDTIDVINQKCHDLKHQIQALRLVSQDQKDEYLNELEKNVMIYDSIIKTENATLNTILSEKSILCEKYNIRFSCITDSSVKELGFIDIFDLYTVIGNALDNSIECVLKSENIENRIISLKIHEKCGYLYIEINNYCEESIKIKNGFPVTTKKDSENHGFGMKSIDYIVKKYNGTMKIYVNDKIFTLILMLPIR